jgi:hypothetical protein
MNASSLAAAPTASAGYSATLWLNGDWSSCIVVRSAAFGRSLHGYCTDCKKASPRTRLKACHGWLPLSPNGNDNELIIAWHYTLETLPS